MELSDTPKLETLASQGRLWRVSVGPPCNALHNVRARKKTDYIFTHAYIKLSDE